MFICLEVKSYKQIACKNVIYRHSIFKTFNFENLKARAHSSPAPPPHTLPIILPLAQYHYITSLNMHLKARVFKPFIWHQKSFFQWNLAHCISLIYTQTKEVLLFEVGVQVQGSTKEVPWLIVVSTKGPNILNILKVSKVWSKVILALLNNLLSSLMGQFLIL